MMDLVDKQAAIDEIREYKVNPNISDDESEIKGFNDGLELAISLLAVLPSVDAVEVVRCKDCKWHRGQWQCLNTDTYGFALDDYCSYGE